MKCFHRCNKTNICFGVGGMAIRCFICSLKQPDLGNNSTVRHKSRWRFLFLKENLVTRLQCTRTHSPVTQQNATNAPSGFSFSSWILNPWSEGLAFGINFLAKVLNCHPAIRFFRSPHINLILTHYNTLYPSRSIHKLFCHQLSA